MLLSRSIPILLSGLTTLGLASTSTPNQCPPSGSTLPAPKRPSEHPAVKAVIQGIRTTLEEQVAGFKSSAVSIGIQSIHEDVPLVDFHYTPPLRNPEHGVEKVDASTVYRVGSISKVFAVLAALKLEEYGELNMDDPVGQWIPEFSSRIDRDDTQSPLYVVNWDDVTVRDVAAHLAGIGGDMALDLAPLDIDWEALGLPKVSDKEKSRICSGNGKPCTREDLLQAFLHRRPPVYAPGQQPVYSNAGFAILGLVVETASNKTFDAFLDEAILKPLNLHDTTMGIQPNAVENMFIPRGSTDWNQDIGILNPGGGMNSNTNDLLAFMTGILKSSIISPAKTNRWLKPDTFISAFSGAVGAPWEIYRIDNLTTDGRIIDLYTKAGGISTYSTQMALIPEFDLAISVLTAGSEVAASYWPQLSMLLITEGLVPVMDLAARSEAQARFAGTYKDEETGSQLTISLDHGSGLVLSDWIARGFKVLPNLNRYNPVGANGTAPSNLTSIRMYPSGLEAEGRAAWRAVFPALMDEEAKLIDHSTALRDASCVTWHMTDKSIYNYLSLDHFEFQFGDAEEATSIEAKGFGIRMNRSPTDS